MMGMGPSPSATWKAIKGRQDEQHAPCTVYVEYLETALAEAIEQRDSWLKAAEEADAEAEEARRVEKNLRGFERLCNERGDRLDRIRDLVDEYSEWSSNDGMKVELAEAIFVQIGMVA